MYLIVTRTFPPELGGMQNLMWGLARSLSKLNLIKVFADYKEGHEEFDKTDAFAWLVDKAVKFDFSMTYPRNNRFGFIYEPWHWALNSKIGEEDCLADFAN